MNIEQLQAAQKKVNDTIIEKKIGDFPSGYNYELFFREGVIFAVGRKQDGMPRIFVITETLKLREVKDF